MSVNRVLRFLAGFLVASLLLFFILPLLGIVAAKFLPPAIAYSHALGTAHGVVIKKEVSPTGNPFKVGDHVYLVSYAFRAPPPLERGQIKPGPSQRYYGIARTDEQTFNNVKPGDPVAKVKYEITYPEINGIDDASTGQSVGTGSNILSGWIFFLLLDLALAYGFMVMLEHFTVKENI